MRTPRERPRDGATTGGCAVKASAPAILKTWRGSRQSPITAGPASPALGPESGLCRRTQGPGGRARRREARPTPDRQGRAGQGRAGLQGEVRGTRRGGGGGRGGPRLGRRGRLPGGRGGAEGRRGGGRAGRGAGGGPAAQPQQHQGRAQPGPRISSGSPPLPHPWRPLPVTPASPAPPGAGPDTAFANPASRVPATRAVDITLWAWIFVSLEIGYWILLDIIGHSGLAVGQVIYQVPRH